MYLEVEERGFILLPDLTHLSWLSLHPRGWRLETGLRPRVLTEAGCPQEASRGPGGVQASCSRLIPLLLNLWPHLL